MAPQPLQKNRLAARRHNTTYCYDFPSVFDNALRGIWAARAAAGEPQSVPPPGKLVEAYELVLAGGCVVVGGGGVRACLVPCSEASFLTVSANRTAC